jgi:hypothetical protein
LTLTLLVAWVSTTRSSTSRTGCVRVVHMTLHLPQV